MRCRRVGANVSPMRGMLSLTLMLIKPAHCCPSSQVPRGLIATKPPPLNLISKLNQRVFFVGHRCRAIVVAGD
jgi:hypothetical protein